MARFNVGDLVYRKDDKSFICKIDLISMNGAYYHMNIIDDLRLSYAVSRKELFRSYIHHPISKSKVWKILQKVSDSEV